MIDLAKSNKDEVPVGYRISLSYNNTDMWQNRDPRVSPCPNCGYRTEFFLTNPDYKTKGRFAPVYAPDVVVDEKTSLAVTYDHQVIASRKFRDWCANNGYFGLEFRELPLDPYHFHMVATNVVEFDTEAGGVRRYNLCLVCGNFESINLTHYALKVSEPLSDGFYRTDLLFKSRGLQSPILIVGTETQSRLRAAKFKGLSFKPVYASPSHDDA